jgi:hypothetical protein
MNVALVSMASQGLRFSMCVTVAEESLLSVWAPGNVQNKSVLRKYVVNIT